MAGQASGRDSLEELMASYQNGSMEAFERVFAVLAPPLRRYLYGFVKDAAIAEDLVQETFLQIHRSRHTYTPPRPVKPWVFAIARHTALMELRRRKRRAPEVLAVEDLPELPVAPSAHGEAGKQIVNRALSGIPVVAQEILIMHHVLGFSFREIAATLGLTEGAAKVRAHRALKALRRAIEAGGGR